MVLIFYRQNIVDQKTGHISVKIIVKGSIDGAMIDIGELLFPTKIAWAKFITALQNGALGVNDLSLSVENIADKEDPKPQ